MVDLRHQGNMTDAGSVPRHSLTSTVVGMAHFAGTGPFGATCGQCKHFVANGQKMICDKYRSMSNPRDGRKAVPSNTAACRYFGARQRS